MAIRANAKRRVKHTVDFRLLGNIFHDLRCHVPPLRVTNDQLPCGISELLHTTQPEKE